MGARYTFSQILDLPTTYLYFSKKKKKKSPLMINWRNTDLQTHMPYTPISQSPISLCSAFNK